MNSVTNLPTDFW